MTLSPILPPWLIVPAGLLLIVLAGWQLVAARRAQRPGLVRDRAARLLLVVLLLVLAGRPAIAGATPGPPADAGLEVYFLVDTTSSMGAEDFGDDGSLRLSGVKADIGGIAQRLQGAQFALVTFDSSAVQRVPLTSDLSALRSSVTAISQEVTSYSAGSSVDTGLDLMTRVLTDADAEYPGRQKVLYYFGDGEQTAEAVPRSFDSLAGFIDGGAVLGYGTENGGRMLSNNGYGNEEVAPTYIQDYSRDPVSDAISRIDEDTLRSIATGLGLEYLHRASGDPIDPLVAGISVAPSAGTSAARGEPVEFYWVVAIPVGILLFRELLLVAGALREIRPRRPGEGS